MKVAIWGIFDAAGEMLATRNTESEAQRCCSYYTRADDRAYTAKPLIVLPDNLMSHKAAWLSALRHVATTVHCEAERDYWQRQLEAMHTMYKELEK